MANPFLAVRISPELAEAIAQRMRETGQTKSELVIHALKYYLGMVPCDQRLLHLERRLDHLEARLEALDLTHPPQEHSHPAPDRG